MLVLQSRVAGPQRNVLEARVPVSLRSGEGVWRQAGSTQGSFFLGCTQKSPLQGQECPNLGLWWLQSELEACSLPAEHLQDLGWCHLACELTNWILSAGKSMLGNCGAGQLPIGVGPSRAVDGRKRALNKCPSLVPGTFSSINSPQILLTTQMTAKEAPRMPG